MDDFELFVSLLTPGSDLVLGVTTERFEAAFGRTGNDTLYVDDPGVTGALSQNIDFLFGDIFDNTEAEFEIIREIQRPGGNPFIILERNIPSVGADRFILGDENQPYYVTSNPTTLTTTNLLGFNEFAVLYDFSSSQDRIQLNGRKQDYRVVEVNNLQVEGVAQPISGEFIFSLQQGVPDAVGFVVNRAEVDINLNDKYFNFVGNKPSKAGGQGKKKIGQLGTNGVDISVGAAADSSGNVYITGSTNGPLGGSSQGASDAWVAKYDSGGNQTFIRQFGTSASDGSNAVVTDKDGNYYLTGTTNGSLFSSKQSGGEDAWVAKYNSGGNLIWSRQFSATSADVLSNGSFGLQVDDTGNVYVSGLAIKENRNTQIFDFAVQDDSWVTKFDSNGNQQWFSEIGSFFFDENYDLAVDKDGNTYAVGWTQGLIGVGGQESDPSRPLLKYDAWVAKFDTNGQRQWVQQLGSTDQDLEFSWGVDTDSQGNVYLTGWQSTGAVGTSSQSYDIWLSKLNSQGTLQWAKEFGSPGDDGMFLADMEIDANDNIFLIGYTNDRLGKGQKDNTYNAWVGRFDTEGNNRWIQQFGSRKNLDYATGVTTDGNGRLYVTGFTEGAIGTGSNGANGASVDAWLAQLDVERGRLQRFIGSPKDITGIEDPGSIPTNNLGNDLVPDDRLPQGDNRIDLAPGNEVIDPRQIESNLGSLFDPNAQNSVTRTFREGINNNNAPFVNPDDRNFINEAIT